MMWVDPNQVANKVTPTMVVDRLFPARVKSSDDLILLEAQNPMDRVISR